MAVLQLQGADAEWISRRNLSKVGEVGHPEAEAGSRFRNAGGGAINGELPDLGEIVGREIGSGIWVIGKWGLVHQSWWIHLISKKLVGIQA